MTFRFFSYYELTIVRIPLEWPTPQPHNGCCCQVSGVKGANTASTAKSESFPTHRPVSL